MCYRGVFFYLIACKFTRFRCAENHTPEGHFRCVMACTLARLKRQGLVLHTHIKVLQLKGMGRITLLPDITLNSKLDQVIKVLLCLQ